MAALYLGLICSSWASALSGSLKPIGSAPSRRDWNERRSVYRGRHRMVRHPVRLRGAHFPSTFPGYPSPISSAQNGAGLSSPATAIALLGKGSGTDVVAYEWHEHGADCCVELVDLRYLQDVCQANRYVCGAGADLAFRNRSLRSSSRCVSPPCPPHIHISPGT
jgi:hypothetical protein